MKKVIDLIRGLFKKEEVCKMGCPEGTCLLSDVVKEMAAMQAETKQLREEYAHAFNDLTSLEKEVSRLTMALAKTDMEKQAMAKEMAAVILHIAKEEAQ